MKRLAALLLVALSAGGVRAADLGGRLTIYTSQPNTDAQQTVDAFRTKHPGVAVTFVRDGTPRILAKLRAELAAGRPQADVLLIADNVTMEGLKKEDRLLPVEDADLSAYPAGLHDPGRAWFATKLIVTGIAYNTKAPFKPESWLDLGGPQAKGQVTMPSPLASGAALIHAATLTANLPQGWGYYEALRGNAAASAGGNGDVLRQVAGGEKLYGMLVDFMAIREAAKGAPIAFAFPKEGVSAVTEPVAVLKGTANPEAAKAFVAFLLSPEGQALTLKQGYIPARPDLPLPPGYPARETIKVMPFDPAKALADERRNKQAFEDIFTP